MAASTSGLAPPRRLAGSASGPNPHRPFTLSDFAGCTEVRQTASVCLQCAATDPSPRAAGVFPMRTVFVATTLATLASLTAGPAGATENSAATCDDLGDLRLADTTITVVESVKAPVEHCKLTGTIGREIGFSLWLPMEWNGKFIMGGGGGFVGNIQNQALGARRSAKGVCHGGHRHRPQQQGNRRFLGVEQPRETRQLRSSRRPSRHRSRQAHRGTALPIGANAFLFRRLLQRRSTGDDVRAALPQGFRHDPGGCASPRLRRDRGGVRQRHPPHVPVDG